MRNDRLFKKTKPARTEEYPLLYKIHKQIQIDFMKEESVELRIGKLPAAGSKSAQDNSGRWTVFVDEELAKSLPEEQLAFLLGHELCHVAESKNIENRNIKNDKISLKTSLFFVQHPISLIIERTQIQSDTSADIAGFFASNDLEAGLSLYSSIHGEEPIKELLEKEFTGQYKPGDVHYFRKIRLAALANFIKYSFANLCKALANPEAQPETNPNPEFKSKIDSLFSTLMAYDHQDDLAITAYLGAALFILSKWKRSSDDFDIFEDLMERFADFDPEYRFTEFETESIALSRMDKFAPNVAGLHHPFKDRAFAMLATAALESRENEEKKIDFIFQEGNRLGYDKDQICNIMKSGIFLWI